MVGYTVPTATQGLFQHVRTYQVRVLGIVAMALVALAAIATFAVELVDVDTVADAGGETGLAIFGGSALVVAGASIAAFVLEVIWLYRARRNLDAFPEASPQWAAGWTIGAWFIPIANLVLPALVIADVVRNSVRPSRVRPVVAMVWVMAITNIIGTCGSLIVSANQRTSGDLEAGAGTWIAAFANLVSAAVEIAVIYAITEDQHARITAGMAAPPVPPTGWQLPYTPYAQLPQQQNTQGYPTPPAAPSVPTTDA
jgi:hypothetical protein